MSSTLAPKEKRTIARPLKILVPLIQHELTAANQAGLEHYRQVGEMLLEAKDQVAHGSWGQWINKNFDLSQKQAQRYMRLAERLRQSNGQDNSNSSPEGEIKSIRNATGETDQRRESRQEQKKIWEPFKKAASGVDVDTLASERRTRDEEITLHRELALELVNLGYKAMAMRLHPDRGGSKEAMTRLNRVHDELKSVAETRRFSL